MRQTSLGFVLLALVCLPFADLSTHVADPWLELQRLGAGLLTPDIPSWSAIQLALFSTLAFAIQGVALGVFLGFLLSLGYAYVGIRLLASTLRSVHELFWALLLLQVLGLSPLTGILALALPYGGTFAKIYGELYEEADPRPRDALGERRRTLSGFFFAVLPLTLRPMAHYTAYRLECGIRSSAVLGFIGLPTLGYHLETAVRQGDYATGAFFFYALVALVATLKLWLRPILIPVYLLLAAIYLPPIAHPDWDLLRQFVTHDMVPAPFRGGGQWLPWLETLWQGQMLPGLKNTLILAILAFAATAAFTLISFPFSSPLFGRPGSRVLAKGLMVLFRSAPEYLLAFLGLMIWGPSMLPGILALSLHNGAIIGTLVSRYTRTLRLREDAATGMNRYFYEVLPRVYRQFLAYSLYRFEIILRETAILGVLGIPTLGFYIDSAFSEMRYDRAIILLLLTAVLNIGVDVISRHLRLQLHLRTQPETL